MSDARRDADAKARARALDVTRSFLVQAPAGSGKTELLIQRFLALLARVDRPERIVAVTFTRKAAGEMRERIVGALRDARDGKPTSSAHEAATRELAQAALAQDARLGWQLVAHPARLAVQTIDALCAGYARQAPLATRLGAAPRYEERAEARYVDAVRGALADAPAADPAWGRLLAHFDNDAAATAGLLAAMLGKRDQWLRQLVRGDRAAFRAELEATLAAEIRDEMVVATRAFPSSPKAELARFERHAAANLDDGARAADLAPALAACAGAGGVPLADVASLDAWRALASWLLVKGEPRFRSTVDRNIGFPAKGKGEGAAERERINAGMRELLAELAAAPGLAAALDVVRGLPEPRYADATWSIASALLDVLPGLAGHLEVAFRATGAVDFTQGTIAALAALGTEDAPTDLLLKLDLRIDHLLIDEFQDTSFAQLDLLRRLTAGWQADDGRTIFAVGDPMQSIYGFREAEVRNFVEAQDEGRIGNVSMENLVLSRNFRSHAGLVECVNAVFPRVLGDRSDKWRGTVAFSPAVPDSAAPPGPTATLTLLPDDAAEAQAVVSHVCAALDRGSKSVAVLVRARTHLDCVLPALRAEGIGFTAVELDALAERQAVQDMVALTHALVQPADRLAWLAVLRAPWCGLVLADLFAVAAAADAHVSGSIAAIVETGAPPGLSDDGRARFERAAGCLRPALAARGRMPVERRVRGAWLALGGGATLDDAIDVEAAERFFGLLAAQQAAGDVPDWELLRAELDALRAEPGAGTADPVQVMTLHRAKGLEFDTVIMPGLARNARRGESPALRWRQRPSGLVLAPSRPRGGEVDPVYAYLGDLAAAEEHAELGRLLYVGCTRAKSRLHLTAVLASEVADDETRSWKRPRKGSSLERLWDALGGLVPPPAETPARQAAERAPSPPPLVRVPAAWTVPLPAAGVPVVVPPAAPREALPFDWARETARIVGVVAHRRLAQLARDGLAAWTEARIAAAAPRIRAELAAEGVDEGELGRATDEVALALASVVTDARGRWLFAPGHADARSEWALAGVADGGVAHVVLDRTFVADGVRWIVDFKTGRHEGADVDAFLDREQERYREQLERYARFVAALDPRPIRLGLFHPLLRGWREWEYPR